MKKTIGIIALLAMSMGLMAQGIQPLPIDSAVRVGRLENGLTYYIRHNEMPKERCEFHIAQAVGATLEEDDQNGLAHFLEHMCFNGTEHFEGKGIINYFESIGVNFGGNINAYTSLDQTVYRLSEVPTFREGIIDSALLVLHDWSCAVSLLPEEIDAERGVIREEWRTGNTASRRAWKYGSQIMFPGTRYATRDVIGDTAVINNFSYDALRAYYKRWYGPDLQAIVVVGDIDVDVIENKIKALWANVPARANFGERPYEVIPSNEEPIVGIYTDKEAQQTAITMLFKHEPMPKQMDGTVQKYVIDLANELIYRMLSERLQEIAMKPNSPIMGGTMAYTDYTPTLDVFYNRFVAKEGQEKEAFALMLREVEKMRRYGFTDDELERAKTDYSNELEKQYNERNATQNNVFVQQYIHNFLDGTAIPGIEFEHQMSKMILSSLTVEALNQIAPEYITANNRVVCITAPEKPEVVLPTEAEIIAALAAMPELEIEAPKASKVDDNLVKKAPKAAKIKTITRNESLGTTEWLLSNGVRVVIKPTEYKRDEILMNAWSFGGQSLVATEDLPSAELATSAVEFMGLGDYSMTDLQKALSGKTVSTNFEISANTEAVTGSSSIKDFETMLQLIYLGFTAPRRDEEAFQTLVAMVANQLRNKDANPKAIFRDSVTMMAQDHHARALCFNMNTLQQVSLDRCMAVYRARFANPADFVFTFVGNIDPEDAKTQQLICTYLGFKAKGAKSERFDDHGIRVAPGIAKNYFTYPMTTHTASNRIQYTSYAIPYTLENSLTMELIGDILSRRYLESIREREGGSYGVGTYGYVSSYPVSRAALIMQFDTDPEKQEKLMNIIHAEVDEIIANGPLSDDLSKDKEAMLKSQAENMEKNGWWSETCLPGWYKLGIDMPRDYVATVNGITAEKVQQMLKNLKDAGNIFEVVMFPQE